jgi:hypothetical protein
MTYRTERRQATDRPDDAGPAAAKSICHRLFSIEQAAEFARVPVQQICHWIMTGELEAYRLHAERIRIDEVEATAGHLHRSAHTSTPVAGILTIR